MEILHHADEELDSSETKCGMNVGQINMGSGGDAVTTCPVGEFGSKENLRGDMACKNCLEVTSLGDAG